MATMNVSLPDELKTFVVPRDPAAPAAETNLLEWQ